jgi:hydrogenase-1 operon protein HyaE
MPATHTGSDGPSWPTVDETTIDAFLAPAHGEPEHVLILFPGSGAPRPETADTLVIFPELIAAFAGLLRGAVVAPQAEANLKGRFQVLVFPSLVVASATTVFDVMPKVLDWSDYIDRIAKTLAPGAEPYRGGKRPDVQFTRPSNGGHAA